MCDAQHAIFIKSYIFVLHWWLLRIYVNTVATNRTLLSFSSAGVRYMAGNLKQTQWIQTTFCYYRNILPELSYTYTHICASFNLKHIEFYQGCIVHGYHFPLCFTLKIKHGPFQRMCQWGEHILTGCLWGFYHLPFQPWWNSNTYNCWQKKQFLGPDIFCEMSMVSIVYVMWNA